MGRRSEVPDIDFINLITKHGPAKTAKLLNIAVRTVYQRRKRLENRLNQEIVVPIRDDVVYRTRQGVKHPARIQLEIKNGIVIIGSDAHYWPGEPSTAHRAFVSFVKEQTPAIVCMNGDVIDATSISRFPPIGWEERPSLVDEIETAQDRLDEIAKACTKKTHKVWTLGNHDGRFERRLATVAPEYAKLHGVHLKDHFPVWEPCWDMWINDDVAVKHRFKGGVHAPWNNTIYAGKTMVTGHLHSAKVVPFSDYRGTRYGVDTGCLADVSAKAFQDYTENSPLNWRSGFGVLTFINGQLMLPELVLVWDDSHVQFRGKVIRV